MRVMFYLVGIFRTSSLGDGILSELNGFEEAGGGVSLYRSLQQGAGRLNFKRLLLFKGKKIAQVKELSTFYVWEDTTVWAN